MATSTSYEYRLGDSWGILFSHSCRLYSRVYKTELGRTAALKDEFAKRNVKVLALWSASTPWKNTWAGSRIINETQKVSVEFPIIADDDMEGEHVI